jgi:homocitrate synthase NifV
MAEKKSGKKIYIIDVTNRDGVQTSRLGLAKLQKTMINLYLNEMGIFQSEFGFPFTHHEINYLNANLALANKKVLYPIRLSGWIRAIEEDVKTATSLTDVKYINMSMSTSDQMIKHKFGGKLDRVSIINSMSKAVKLAKKKGIKAVGVNAEDASRTEMEYLIEFAQAAKAAGADRVRYCDTGGSTTRSQYMTGSRRLPWRLRCR